MKRGKHYNIIVVLLLVIISAITGVSAAFSVNAGPGFPNENNDSSGFEDIETEAPSERNDAPSANAPALTKLMFALDVLNNGKGFRSESKQTMWVNTINRGQYMKFEKLRGGGLNLAQEWFEFSHKGGITAGHAKFEYISRFVDGDTMQVKTITDKSKFNFESKAVDYSASGKIETINYNEYLQQRRPLNDFFLNIDEKSVSSIKEDKRSSALNYIITVTINTGEISQKYLNTFSANGGEGITIDKLVLTFEISKKTGFLRKYEKVEDFTGKIGIFSGSSTATLEEVFYEMDVSKEGEIKAIASQLYA